MAKFYGRTTRHLLVKDVEYYLLGAGLIVLPLFLVLITVKFFSSGAALGAAIIAIIFVGILSKFFQRGFRSKSRRYYRGWGGEKEIQKELKNLSNDWSVFQDVTIGEKKGNIDFVIVGPKGIFLLEAKSHRGSVGLSGDTLTLDGKSFADKNFFKQVHGQTWALKTYLEARTGKNIFVNSVLVFSNPRAIVNFGFTQISNIYIIQKGFLLPLLSRFSDFNYPVPQAVVEQALRATVAK